MLRFPRFSVSGGGLCRKQRNSSVGAKLTALLLTNRKTAGAHVQHLVGIGVVDSLCEAVFSFSVPFTAGVIFLVYIYEVFLSYIVSCRAVTKTFDVRSQRAPSI